MRKCRFVPFSNHSQIASLGWFFMFMKRFSELFFKAYVKSCDVISRRKMRCAPSFNTECSGASFNSAQYIFIKRTQFHFPLQNNAATDIVMGKFISELQSWPKPWFDNDEKLHDIRENRAWYREMKLRRLFHIWN